MLLKKHLTYILTSFILLVFSTTFILNHVNKKREIFFEPDDFYHYLIKSSNISNCKNQACYEKNLYKKKINVTQKEQWSHDRQIHRLVLSYHSLYTFLLNKISNNENVFEIHKQFHIFLGVLSALILLFYLKNFLNPKQLLLVTIVITSHYYINNWGLKYPIAWSISTICASFGMIWQFKNKIISAFFFITSVLLHPIGLVLLFFSYLTYSIYKFIYEERYILKLNFIFYLLKYGFILFLIFLFGYFTKFTVFDLSNLSASNVYEFQPKWENIFNNLKDNAEMFYDRSLFSIIILNPILLFFFLYSLFLNINKKINYLKIFTIILIFSYIFFIIPGAGGSEFAIGKRTWAIFIINYIILSITAMLYLSKINIIYKGLKIIYLSTLPIFLLFNFSYNIHPIKSIIDRHNNYYNKENIENFKNRLQNEKILYFDSSERLFYYYLISGFIQNNVYFKGSYPPQKIINKSEFIITDNPIRLSRSESDIILENNSVLRINNFSKKYELIIHSKNETKIIINQKEISLNKGTNNMVFNENILNFESVANPVRIIGLKIDSSQKTYWPWFSNLKFEFSRDVMLRSQKIFFYNNYVIKKVDRFDFTKLSKQFQNIKPQCNRSIISDIDSSIIISLNC